MQAWRRCPEHAWDASFPCLRDPAQDLKVIVLTWRSIEEQVPEGRPMQARIGGDSGQRAHMVLQAPRKHDVAEIAPHLLCALLAAATTLPPVLPRCLTHQLGRAQPPA